MANILLAEDDEAMRRFLTSALERAGHRVVAVGDGVEAMQKTADHAFDLLIADIVMPGMDGIELSRQATRDNTDLKVLFITGFAAVVMSAKREVDNAHILSKPFHLRDLVENVEALLTA